MSLPEEQKEVKTSRAAPRFSSGPWQGYYAQSTPGGLDVGWMDLHLNFVEGGVAGRGRDRVGKFVLQGRYDIREGHCVLAKKYVGKHEVLYVGAGDEKGIRGRWRIEKLDSGAFHIWPLAGERGCGPGAR